MSFADRAVCARCSYIRCPGFSLFYKGVMRRRCVEDPIAALAINRSWRSRTGASGSPRPTFSAQYTAKNRRGKRRS
jgi:hypothetical protein